MQIDELIEQLEALKAPSRELDREFYHLAAELSYRFEDELPGTPVAFYYPRLTGSFEAIYSLIGLVKPELRIQVLLSGLRDEEGEYTHVNLWRPPGRQPKRVYRGANAPTLALALCLAFAYALKDEEEDA